MTVEQYLKANPSCSSLLRELNDGKGMVVSCASCEMTMLLRLDMIAGPDGELLCDGCAASHSDSDKE